MMIDVHWPPRDWLAKTYPEGRLNLLFVLNGFCSPPLIAGHAEGTRKCQRHFHLRTENELARSANWKPGQGGNTRHVELDIAIGENQEPVLISDVEFMQSKQQIVAAPVRLELADYCDDLFSGQVYLSLRNGSFKGVRFPEEGKLDSTGIERFLTNKGEDRKIEGRTEIVDSIPDDQGKIGGDGYFMLDAKGALLRFGVIPNYRLEWFFGQKIVDGRIQIIDMMLGPLY